MRCPGCICHGEAFNPHFIGTKDRLDYLGVSIAARDADPFALLARMRAETAGLSGFRFFLDHDPRILDGDAGRSGLCEDHPEPQSAGQLHLAEDRAGDGPVEADESQEPAQRAGRVRCDRV